MTSPVLSRLAHSLGRRDEVPNVALAEALAAKADPAAVQALVDHLSNKTTAIRSDCIKVLYELGDRAPAQIAGHAVVFIDLLQSKDNRLQWGAMSALAGIAEGGLQHVLIARNIARVVEAADRGSVITRDRAVHTLAALACEAKHAKTMLPLLLDQVLRCPVNQLPAYAERTQAVVDAAHRARLIEILEARMAEALPPPKRKRLERVLAKLVKTA